MVVTNDEEAAQPQDEEAHPDAPIEGCDGHLTEFEEDDDSPPTPRFLQDQGAYRRWRWIPPSLRRAGKAAKKWVKGPRPPQIQVIKPLFPDIQEAPIKLLDLYLPKKTQKLGLLLAFYFCWMLTFALVFRQGTLVTEIEGYGRPVEIGCGRTFWGRGNSCGIDGGDCRPFNNSSFPFRCPGECAKRWVLNPRAVGPLRVIYQPLVIGGPHPDDPDRAAYRGDSFICGAAIHAGIIGNPTGGCGVVELAGLQWQFFSSDRHGISSIPFDSYFPLSFKFAQGTKCEAKDMRWALLAVSLTFTILLSLFTTSPSVFFWSIFTGIFVHVGFASDPPNYSTIPGLVSNLLSKFLPAAYCAFVIYRYVITRTLSGLRAHIEKSTLWLGGCWLGALSNITLDWIPIQRLNGPDLAQQPGAYLALSLIIALLVVIVLQQAHYFRLEGRMPQHLALYGLFISGILLSLCIPGLSLRIHHYILALFFLPGTSMQTRPALLYQGLLVGLFINGIARWGFDSILQTPAALLGDGQHFSALPTPLTPISISLGTSLSQPSNISFKWDLPPSPYDGFSVLVNDVERFRGYTDQGYGMGREWTWSREAGMAGSQGRQGFPEYFRFGFMEGNNNQDYSRAGTWLPDGSWVEMEPGPSQVWSGTFVDEE